MKSVVCTGTKIEIFSVFDRLSPKKPPKDICNRLCFCEKSWISAE